MCSSPRLAGCVLPFGYTRPNSDLREGLSRKKVWDKHEHTVLVAVDRST